MVARVPHQLLHERCRRPRRRRHPDAPEVGRAGSLWIAGSPAIRALRGRCTAREASRVPARGTGVARAYDGGSSGADARAGRVVHRPQRHRRRRSRSPAMSTSHAPASSQSLVTGSSALDEGQPDGRAERPAVRRGADVADHHAVPQHRLGVVEQRLGVAEPRSAPAAGVDGNDAFRASSAALPRKSVSHATAKPRPTSSGQSVLSMSWPKSR